MSRASPRVRRRQRSFGNAVMLPPMRHLPFVAAVLLTGCGTTTVITTVLPPHRLQAPICPQAVILHDTPGEIPPGGRLLARLRVEGVDSVSPTTRSAVAFRKKPPSWVRIVCSPPRSQRQARSQPWAWRPPRASTPKIALAFRWKRPQIPIAADTPQRLFRQIPPSTARDSPTRSSSRTIRFGRTSNARRAGPLRSGRL